MAQQLNPSPDEVAADEYAVVAEVAPRVAEMSTELSELREAVDLLTELARPLGEPAQLTTETLTKATKRKMLDERGIVTASIAVLNPNAATILLGFGGVPATSQARAVSIPPESLIVLPIAAGDVEIGTEASLEEGDAVVHVFRYRTVQPAFLGVAP